MARPSKYTPERAEAVVKAIGNGLTRKDAALVAGVHPDTVGNWAERYSDFSDRLARAEAERSRKWLRAMAAIAVDSKDWRAFAELLDRCAPDYRKTEKHDHTHEHGGTVRHEHAALAAAARRVAEEEGLDYDEVQAEADAIVAGAQR